MQIKQFRRTIIPAVKGLYRFRRGLIPLIITLSAVGLGAQDTWYVSTGGSNSNPGTIDKPFRTLQHVCNIVDPGDTVILRGGIYRNEQVVLSRSGTPTQWITFRNYPGEEPVLQYSIDMTDESDWIDQGNNIWYSKDGSFAWEVNHDVATIWHDGSSHWSYKKYNPGEQAKQWDFYHNLDAGRVEVYSTANPATLASELEIPVDPGTTQNQFNLTCRADYIIWDGLSIRYCNMHGMQVASGHHHVIFRNGRITHGGGGNVYPGRTPRVRWGDALDVTGSVHDVIFENNYLAEWPDGTLTNQGTRGQQYNLWFINNYVARSTNGFHCWFGSTDASENGNTWLRDIYYEGNVFEDIGQGWFEDQGVMQGAIQFNPRNGVATSNINIRNNTFINCGTDRFEAGTWRGVNCAVNVGGGEVIVAGNIIYGGESQGIEIHTRHQPFTGEVYNNLIYDTPWSGLRIDGDWKTPGARIYNNTVVNCGDDSRANMALFSMSNTSEVYNNISYSAKSLELYWTGGGLCDYNCFGSYGGIGANSVTGYPGFADTAHHDYRITAGSPCFNSGRGEGAPLLDLDSLPRPDGVEIDMGAYEFPYPQIRIHGPDEDSLYIPPATIPVTAEVSLNDHPVSRVEFFRNDTLLVALTTPPWEYTWLDLQQGEHLIHAAGNDTAGNVFQSRSLAVHVLPSAMPAASISHPQEGDHYAIGDTVEISVEASDDGEIVSVEFMVEGSVSGIDSVRPFKLPWIPKEPGIFAISARITDNTGLMATAEPIQVNVKYKIWPVTYFEDFDDNEAQDWNAGSGTWEVHEREYWNSTNGIYDISIYGGSTFAGFEYSADMKPDWGNPFGLVFNYSDESNYFMARLDVEPPVASIVQVQDGVENIIAEGSYNGGGTGIQIRVKVVNDGFSTSLLVNGDTIFDSIPAGEPRFGYIGLFSQLNWLWFDNVLVEADSTALADSTVFPTGLETRWALSPVLHIFPNPSVNGEVTIHADNMIPPLSVEIYDIKGKLVHYSGLHPNRFRVTTGNRVCPGLYFIRLTGEYMNNNTVSGRYVVFL